MRCFYLVLFIMSWLLCSCSKSPVDPIAGKGLDQAGSAEVNIALGKPGVLAKASTINLQKLYITLYCSTRAIHDTVNLSGNGEINVNRTYSGLESFIPWTLQAESRDQSDSIIHIGDTVFSVLPKQTTGVSLSLDAAYSMLAARFYPIRDSVTRCEILVDGALKANVSFGKQTRLGDTVNLNFDYLKASKTGTSKTIKMDVYGEMWGIDTLLYSGDTVINVVSGLDKSYSMTLKWKGPKTPPPGQVSMSVILGKVGMVTVNGVMLSALGLPENAFIAALWAKLENNVFVAVNQNGNTDSSKVFVYYYNGVSWDTQLQLSGGKRYIPSGKTLFGTSGNDIFLNVRNNSANISEVYHFNGTIWQQQTLPAQLGGDGLGNFTGEANNIYAGAGSNLFKYNGVSWQYAANLSPRGAGNLIYISANEIYALDCWGHTLWNGTTWTWYQSFDFCDVGTGWGMRDSSNNLFMFATGCNNFQNSIMVWRFIESSPGSKIGSWGSKYDPTYLSDPYPGYAYAGFANDIWGSGPNDIYVVGHFGHPYNPAYALRIYHSGGTYPFARMTIFDNLPLEINENSRSYISITGTGANDVWIAVGNKLVHSDNVSPQKWTMY